MEDLAGLKSFLDEKVAYYNRVSFISKDPISIPHLFTAKQDIEIAGLFAATLAWGNRTSILNSGRRLMELMDNSPFAFITQHAESDRRRFLGFAHRTFNTTDLLCFIEFLQQHYRQYPSLEDAFVPADQYTDENVYAALADFHHYFFSVADCQRTRKHVATPVRDSACKRLNMYLRWMVRADGQGVDFGLWKKIMPAQLICPLDVHVARVAERLGLLENIKSNKTNALQLTERLKELNPLDPVIYDFALFSLGAEERY